MAEYMWILEIAKLEIYLSKKHEWASKMFRISYPVQMCNSSMLMKFKNIKLDVNYKSSVSYSNLQNSYLEFYISEKCK